MSFERTPAILGNAAFERLATVPTPRAVLAAGERPEPA
jgi:hypothetical protein